MKDLQYKGVVSPSPTPMAGGQTLALSTGHGKQHGKYWNVLRIAVHRTHVAVTISNSLRDLMANERCLIGLGELMAMIESMNLSSRSLKHFPASENQQLLLPVS